MINCFILGKTDVVREFAEDWLEAKMLSINDDLGIVEITENLMEDIIDLTGNPLYRVFDDTFLVLNKAFHELLIYKSFKTEIVYIETTNMNFDDTLSTMIYRNGLASIGLEIGNQQFYGSNFNQLGRKITRVIGL